MKYEGMLKTFFKKPDEFESIYQKNFNSIFSFKYNISIGKYQAFVMHIPEISKLVSKIYQLDKELGILCWQSNIPQKALEQFLKTCIIDEVKLTNEIEGVHSTRKEIQSLLEKEKHDKKQEDRTQRLAGLVYKYVILAGSDQVLKLDNCQDIRRLYDEIVLPEVKENKGNIPDGEIFRKEGVEVCSPGGNVIHAGIMPESKVISELDQVIEILKSEEPDPLINIAVFHYLFGYIHPFYDGNGRMVRFISSSFLAVYLEKIVGLGLSYTVKENLSEYYKMFDTTNDPRNRGDLTLFVVGFLSFIVKTMNRIIDDLTEKNRLLEFYDDKISELKLTKDMHKLLYVVVQATLFSEDKGISKTELASVLEVGKTTLYTSLRGFSSNLIIIKKKGRDNYYSANLSVLDGSFK